MHALITDEVPLRPVVGEPHQDEVDHAVQVEKLPPLISCLATKFARIGFMFDKEGLACLETQLQEIRF